MDNLHILCISDIHFHKLEASNQGLVIDEFFKDLDRVLCGLDKSSVYCIIAGDLVQAGNVDKSYNDFNNGFLKRLLKYVDLDHVLCTPGNHDLNRNILNDKKKREEHESLIESSLDELQFNDLLADDNSIIREKFKSYNSFCTGTMLMQNYDLFGFSTNIIPEISVFCLNSALLANGGLEGLPKDEGRLRIHTNALYEWAKNNSGRTMILVMHHPLYHLSEYAKKELGNIIDKNVNILITGHLHSQDFKQWIGVSNGNCKFCSSPQLFSSKKDINGYSILHFSDKQLDSIEYRQWSTIHEVFVSGSSFTTTDDGRIVFSKQLFTSDDIISKELEEKLQQSLQVYNYLPSWVDRIISNVPVRLMDSSMKEEKFDYFDIINSDSNIQLVGGAQFGLTSYCHKLIFEAWKNFKEHWLYIEGKNLRLSEIQSNVDFFKKNRGIEDHQIKTVIFDNWGKAKDDNTKILEKIQHILPGARLILINNEEDSDFFQGLKNELKNEDFRVLYLRELGRRAIRQITNEFIKKNGLINDEEDKMLERLVIELMALNVHRTPINCIQLLMNFKQNYEARPINRSKVLSALLQFFFIKPDSFFYTESIDENDCCKIMGALCEHLMRNNNGKYYQQYFSKEEFEKVSEKGNEKVPLRIRQKLFDAMLDAKVIIPYLEYYEFRFSYWVYYFVAYQMYRSEPFYKYMVEEQNCLLMPDIIEFYTGIDDKCTDIVVSITEKLNSTCSNVTDQFIGYKVSNPLDGLKCIPNPILESKTNEQLELDIKQSRLPDDIKDRFLDKSYSCDKPFLQAIERVIDDHNVHNMMLLSKSASRAFRNSELIDDEIRSKLYGAIQESWKTLFKVLVLLSPALSRTGQGRMGGASFMLVEEFPEDLDFQERRIKILTAIPANIVLWFFNDVFSDKKFEYYKDLLSNKDVDVICKHINALLIIYGRPSGWKDVISNYVKTLKRNSYYSGDICTFLSYCYRICAMSTPDLKRTGHLLLSCIDRLKTRKKNKILPKREAYDL